MVVVTAFYTTYPLWRLGRKVLRPTGAREEGYWNVRYDDTGQKETAQMENPGSTEENGKWTGTMYISELSHCVL